MCVSRRVGCTRIHIRLHKDKRHAHTHKHIGIHNDMPTSIHKDKHINAYAHIHMEHEPGSQGDS